MAVVLASSGATWQGAAMASPSPSAGGAPIALGAILGAAIGFFANETTAGFLVGLGIGVAAAAAIWWRERR